MPATGAFYTCRRKTAPVRQKHEIRRGLGLYSDFCLKSGLGLQDFYPAASN